MNGEGIVMTLSLLTTSAVFSIFAVIDMTISGTRETEWRFWAIVFGIFGVLASVGFFLSL